MTGKYRRAGLTAVLTWVCACAGTPKVMSELQQSAIADSVKTALNTVLKNSEQLNFAAAMKPYAADSDARFMENGYLYSSGVEFRQAFDAMAPSIDSIENRVDHWDITVLSPDAAAFTLPAHYRIKVKGRPGYNGQWVWSGVVQKRAGEWQIIQSHESWLNAAEAMAALMPLEPVKLGGMERPLPKKP